MSAWQRAVVNPWLWAKLGSLDASNGVRWRVSRSSPIFVDVLSAFCVLLVIVTILSQAKNWYRQLLRPKLVMVQGDEAPKVGNVAISGPLRQYMKLIEKKNFERAQNLRRMRRNNIITGWLLGTGVLAIYFYSMFSVKQERFLDDFEEPKTISS